MVNSTYDTALAPYGLTGNQFSILSLILGYGPISPSRIVDFMHMEKSTVSRNLKLMEKSGLVTSRVLGRNREIDITETGIQTYCNSMVGWKKAQQLMKQRLQEHGIDAVAELSRLMNV